MEQKLPINVGVKQPIFYKNIPNLQLRLYLLILQFFS